MGPSCVPREQLGQAGKGSRRQYGGGNIRFSLAYFPARSRHLCFLLVPSLLSLQQMLTGASSHEPQPMIHILLELDATAQVAVEGSLKAPGVHQGARFPSVLRYESSDCCSSPSVFSRLLSESFESLYRKHPISPGNINSSLAAHHLIQHLRCIA